MEQMEMWKVLEIFTPLQKDLNVFVKLINKDFKVKIDINFECDIWTNTIYFGLSNFVKTQMENANMIANDLAVSGFDFQDYCNPQTYSFFHELGHIAMAQYYKDKMFQHKKYSMQVNSLNKAYEEDYISWNKRNQKYNKIDMENDANSWAMLFILENPEVVKEYERVVFKHIAIASR